MKEIARFKGQNGIIIVNDDSLEISRQSFGGFIAQGGFVGNRIYNYEDISSIEYRKPTLLANGYFKINVQGTNEVNAKVDLL